MWVSRSFGARRVATIFAGVHARVAVHPVAQFAVSLVTFAAIAITGCADDDSSATPSGSGDTRGDDPGDSTAAAASTGGNTGSEDTASVPDPRLAVTADWQAGSLSLLDLDQLAAGATARQDILVDTIDLSMYAPGPLQVELTPDGATAVVSISPGFFDGFVGNLIGVGDVELTGMLLIVDIASRSVVAELSPAHVPMGIAIAPDAATAYTANYGAGDSVGTTMSVIDLQSMAVVDDIEVGERPEQVSLSDDGALGIINLASDGTIRTFETADPAGTLSTPLALSDDPSDVDFIEGTALAIVTNSVGPSSYALVDVSDPANPMLAEDAPPPGGVPYGATPIPGTTDALVTLTDFNQLTVVRVAAASAPSTVVWTTNLPDTNGFPLGIAIDSANGIAISAVPGDNALLTLDLDGGVVSVIPWLDLTSPTYVALQPT